MSIYQDKFKKCMSQVHITELINHFELHNSICLEKSKKPLSPPPSSTQTPSPSVDNHPICPPFSPFSPFSQYLS